MRIDLVTLFPEMFSVVRDLGVTGRAHSNRLWSLHTHSPRDYTEDVHRTVDDPVFGGGAGMLMKPEPIFAAVEEVKPPRPLLLMGPGGQQFSQEMAQHLASDIAQSGGFSILCGRYEGVDHRVREHLVDHEVSVGDVVLAGGEVAACLIIEAVTRLLPGVMGNAESPITESFGAEGLLEEPQFTRPADFRGWVVPEVLREGNHAKIARWRLAQALHRTLLARPDLIAARGGISTKEASLLEEFPSLAYPSMFIQSGSHPAPHQ
jgi:tRNA (guanine37-N1)-methyltransferase